MFSEFFVGTFVIILTIKAVEARNLGYGYAASDGTMFTFCF